jgi:hypothetical protein
VKFRWAERAIARWNSIAQTVEVQSDQMFSVPFRFCCQSTQY